MNRWPSGIRARSQAEFRSRPEDQKAFDYRKLALGYCVTCGGFNHTVSRQPSSPKEDCTCHPATADADSAALDASRQDSSPVVSESRNGDSMSSNLPVTEVAARSLFSKFDHPLNELMREGEELAQRVHKNGLTRMTVEEARALDLKAREYLTAIADPTRSEGAEARVGALRAKQFLDKMFNAATKPVEGLRTTISGWLSRYEMERKRKADEERRQREEAARKEQERQRIEEAAHLESLGHKEEAQAHLDAPLPPVALPEEKAPAGKVQGVTIIETYKLDRIIDPKALAGYLVEHPEDLIALFEPKANEWKRRATSAKGTWAVPGVTFVMVPESRNRG